MQLAFADSLTQKRFELRVSPVRDGIFVADLICKNAVPTGTFI